MLNLASLYVEGRDPSHGNEEAVQLVEKAMRLGIPAAYDRMGRIMRTVRAWQAIPLGLMPSGKGWRHG
jgi:hypothetical protein